MNRLAPLLLAPLILLASCGEGTPAENSAAQLDKAAEQSEPAAAAVLENAADGLREGGAVDANAAAQQALEQAGQAQVGQSGQGDQGQPVPARQAKPQGDPAPPPPQQ